MTRSNRPTVLILASDPAFSREITAHWPGDPDPYKNPEFTILDQNFTPALQASPYDLAIADAYSVEKSKSEKRTPLNRRLNRDLQVSLVAAGKPAILIHSDPARDFYNVHGAVLELRREPKIWPMLTALIGREILRRSQAESHARHSEAICTAAQAEATLGRYMLEMRANVNNALTTVLGNAELLTHTAGLPSAVLAQADAIRNMALRLHEVFQRFSSLEKELAVAARTTSQKSAAASR
jgi:hypothetical protein